MPRHCPAGSLPQGTDGKRPDDKTQTQSEIGRNMTEQPSAPAVSAADPEPGRPATPAGTAAIGDLVISWYDDEPVTYGGPADRSSFTTLSFEFLSKSAPVRKCDPDQVAPAGIPVAEKDARVSVVKCPRAEMPYGAAGPWKLTLPGATRPSWHRTKRDGTVTGLRRMAILDWHAACPPLSGERGPAVGVPDTVQGR
jgi:hypothetical protein